MQRKMSRGSVKDGEKKAKRNLKKEEPIPFLVNRNGFPIDGDSWERMWQFAAIQHLDKKDMIFAARHITNLPKVSKPPAPVLLANRYVNVWEYTMSVQDYLERLQYNHTGTQFFEIKKSKSLAGLMETAKSMTEESLPIKCLESVILSIYLTNGLPGTERFPINFKSKFCGRNYYHVVLGLYYAGVYGTLGLSRRADLMYKPLLHKTLSDMIFDFINCYQRYHHRVIKVTVGTYVPHDPKVNDRVVWKGLSLHMNRLPEDSARRELDKYARLMRNNAVPLNTPIILPPQGLLNHLGNGRPPTKLASEDVALNLVHNLIEETEMSERQPYKIRI